MKKNKCFILFFVFCIILYNCSFDKKNKSETDDLLDIRVDTVFIRDTVFIKVPTLIKEVIDSIDKCSISRSYLTINKFLEGGDLGKDNEEGYSYYRVLDCSVEEMSWIEIEEIKLIYDGMIVLVDRKEVDPNVFGLEDANVYFNKWISPTVVRLSVKEGKWEKYDLDIPNMRATLVIE